MKHRNKRPANVSSTSPQEEIDRYVRWWRRRGNRVAKLMGNWKLVAFNPGFNFLREDGRSIVNMDLDVVEKIIRIADGKIN